MKRYIAFIIIFFTGIHFLNAQVQLLSEKIGKERIPVTVCFGSNETEQVIIPPPTDFLLKSEDTKKSDINVTYSLFPPEAKKAFDYAISIWESIIQSEITIQVEANWRSMEESNTLGSAAPADFVTGFKNIPHKNKYYPLALAEKLSGEDINPYSSPDIVCTFNKDIQWYFGLDQETPPLMYDFVTVVLHEIGHGLGFTGFFDIRSNQGLYEYEYESLDGFTSTFDLLVVNATKKQLVNKDIYPMPSNELYFALTSGALYSNSKSAAYDNNGSIPRLFVPTNWDRGSSIYHLNDLTYPASSGNSLMTPYISRGETVHNPGHVTVGIMDDMGWNHILFNLEKPKDTEQIEPIVFKTTVDSYNELDSASAFVMYSTNSPDNFNDSIPLTFNHSEGYFTASILPESNDVDYYYYIKITDIKSRTFRYPTEDDGTLTVSVGTDTEKPVISHTPIEYFLTINKEIEVSAKIEDNLGVDTAYIEFSVNNISFEPFGLIKEANNTYKAKFPLEVNQLNDGDLISYKIFAIDSSVSRNTTSSPTRKLFSFKIEKISDPVSNYQNDFNSSTSDFTQYDFEISTEENFSDGALNSPHPYPSPNKNNTDFNFTAILKKPITIQSSTTISYDEVVLVEPGEDLTSFNDEEFWDYVIVEASKDNGQTWLPIINGYDSRENTSWEESYNLQFDDKRSLAVGSSDLFVNRTISLTENGNFESGDTVLIRFRLFSDPYANGWGWCIDNLNIQTVVSASTTQLSPGNIMVYPNPFNEMVNLSIQPKNPVNKIQVEMYNIYGQEVFSKFYDNISGEITESINLEEKASGIYLLNIKENGMNIYSKKLVKH